MFKTVRLHFGKDLKVSEVDLVDNSGETVISILNAEYNKTVDAKVLLSISLLLAAVFSLDARGVSVVTEPVEVTGITETAYLFRFDGDESTRYTVAITFKNASFSGICVVKNIGTQIAGTIVNEFGIRAFDFTMSQDRRRVKLLTVMKPLDKCLIRKAIARDLKRLFNATTTDGYVSVDGEKIIMRRPGRSYTFSK